MRRLERPPTSERLTTSRRACSPTDNPPPRTYSHSHAQGHEDGQALSNNVGGSLATTTISPGLCRPRVDALATVDPEHDEARLFGESSTIAFVREVAQAARTDRTSPWIPTEDHATAVTSAATRALDSLEPLDLSLQGNEDAAVLPHRRKADDYLHCFWEFVHPLFPVLHGPTFTRRYEQLWLPHDPETSLSSVEETLFMPTLNLAFALGCQFSDLVPSDQKAAVANSFYERSRVILLFDVLGTTSVSVVQWLLLSGIYLQSTSHASHCWNSVGLAIRLAQSLGLHLERSSRNPEPQLKREMKRRIWHTCVVLDRSVPLFTRRRL